MSTILSLAIVLLVLIYVFPLRLMFESAFHMMSGRLLPGRDLPRLQADLSRPRGTRSFSEHLRRAAPDAAL